MDIVTNAAAIVTIRARRIGWCRRIADGSIETVRLKPDITDDK